MSQRAANGGGGNLRHAPPTLHGANQEPFLQLCASVLRRREEFPAYWVPPLSAPLWLSVPVLILSRTLK